MKNKKAYFSKVPLVGNLYLYDEFLSLDIPVLFLCNDNQNNMYICSCFELYPQLSWAISSIKKVHILDFIENKISIADAFREGEKKYVAVWNKDDRCEHIHQVSQYDNTMLPDDDEYLDAENGEYDDIKEKIYKLLNFIPEDIPQYYGTENFIFLNLNFFNGDFVDSEYTTKADIKIKKDKKTFFYRDDKDIKNKKIQYKTILQLC